MRPRKKWKTIILCVLGAFFLAVAILALANLSVLKLVFSPGNIEVSELDESITTLERLESAGSVRNLEISADRNRVSFFNADESIKVASEYDGGRVRRVSGEIDAARINVSTIDEGRELARAMLSPYFNDAEIAAILLRSSPEIIANIGSGDINMSFDIGDNYNVSITGSAYDMIEFNILTKQ